MRTFPFFFTLAAFLMVGCKPDSLGSTDSYVVFGPAKDSRYPAQGLVSVQPANDRDEATQRFARTFVRSLVPEAMGSIYVANRHLGRADPVCLMQGLTGAPDEGGRGFSVPRTFGADATYPSTLWLTIPALFGDEKEDQVAVVQTLTRQAVRLAATAGAWDRTSPPAPVEAGFVIAMEVIAREWRVPGTARGAFFGPHATAAARDQFAGIRDNSFIKTDGRLRDPTELMNDPRVAATVIYRMAQSRAIGQRMAPRDFYARIVPGPVPEGMNPALLLGPVRNFNAKLLGIWAKEAGARRSVRTVVDLVAAYGQEFPAERSDLVRLFLVTTLGATVKPGGVDPDRGADTAKEFDLLTADVVAGRLALIAGPARP